MVSSSHPSQSPKRHLDRSDVFAGHTYTQTVTQTDAPWLFDYCTLEVLLLTHRHTDRPRYSVCSNSPHLMQCMRCGLIIIIIIIITKMTFIYADILHSRCVGGGKTVKTKEKLYLCQAELWRHSALLEGLTVTGSYTCTARALKSVLPDVLAIHTTEMTPKSSLQVTYWLMQTTVACSML